MKTKPTRPQHKFELRVSWSQSYYLDRLTKLEKLLRKKARSVQIDFIGGGEIPPDIALLIRGALMERSPRTHIITNARSSLQGGAAMLWLLGDTRLIRDDARIFFRPADLPEDAEVDPDADWTLQIVNYRDSPCEIDPEEGDYARVLQVIDEFLPVKEFAGRLIGVAVLKQFGLVDNAGVDNFLTNVFSRRNQNTAGRGTRQAK